MSAMFIENYALQSVNSFAIEARALQYASFDNEASLHVLLKERNASLPLFILGGGSNILFTKDFDGLVLHNKITGIDIVENNANDVLLKVGAGEIWHDVVTWCVTNDYYGIENLALIPGTIGAAPVQNIGAYGVELKDCFVALDAIDIENNQQKVYLTNAACKFGYRDSIFKHEAKGKYIITHVYLQLHRSNVVNNTYQALQQYFTQHNIVTPNCKDVYNAVIAIRQSKLPDPKIIGNAGSFFKNPVVPIHQFNQLKIVFPNIVGFPFTDTHSKIAAGWLIEQAGFKGYREGDAGCYEKQALVIVNHGNATGKQLYALSEKIIAVVKERFGVTLEREVNIL